MADTPEISENLEGIYQSGNILTRANFRFFARFSGLNDVPRDAAVLDCGCATGFLLEYLTDKGFTRADGIDSFASMAEVAQTRTKGTVYVDDVANVGNFFEADTYDVVIASNIIHHLTDFDEWNVFFAGCRKILKPGGTFIIREPEPTLVHRTLDAMARYPIFYVGPLVPRLGSFRDEVDIHQYFFDHWLDDYKGILGKHGFEVVSDTVWIVHRILTAKLQSAARSASAAD